MKRKSHLPDEDALLAEFLADDLQGDAREVLELASQPWIQGDGELDESQIASLVDMLGRMSVCFLGLGEELLDQALVEAMDAIVRRACQHVAGAPQRGDETDLTGELRLQLELCGSSFHRSMILNLPVRRRRIARGTRIAAHWLLDK